MLIPLLSLTIILTVWISSIPSIKTNHSFMSENTMTTNHSKLVKDVMPKRFIGKFSDFQKLIKSKL